MDENYQRESELLVQKLKERDEELIQAGKYGKSMLETNSHLESMLKQMNEEYEKKLEDLEQEKFSLEVKVEALRNSADQASAALLHEKQLLSNNHQSDINTLEKQHKIALGQVNQKLIDVQKELDETALVKQQLLEKVDKQQCVISELKSSLKKQSNANNCPVPDVNELHQVIVGLQEENDSIADELNDMRNYSEQIRLQVEEHKKTNEFLNEMKISAERELQNCSEALEHCQFTNQELMRELEELRSHPQDPASRGNSLFAEVEDRRVQAEKKLISCQVKLNCFEKKYKQQLNYSMRLKAQIAQLLQSGGRDADRERISRLEHSLASSQKSSKQLVEKIADLEAKLGTELCANISNSKSQNNSGEEFAKFLQDLLKKKECEMKKLSDDLQKCHMDLLSESRRANEADIDVYAAQSERDKLKSQSIKLKMEVTRLKLKCGEEGQGKRVSKSGNVEKLLVSQPSSSNNLTDLNKENTPNNSVSLKAEDDVPTPSESLPQLNKTSVSEQKKPEKEISSQNVLKETPQECRQQ